MAASLPVPRAPLDGRTWWTAPRVAQLGLVWPPLTVGALVLAAYRPSLAGLPATAAVVALALAAQWLAAGWIASATQHAEAWLRAFLAQTAIAATSAALLAALEVPPPTPDRHGDQPVVLLAVLAAVSAAFLLATWQGALASVVVTELRTPSHETRDRLVVRLGGGAGVTAALVGIMCLAGRSLTPAVAVPWTALAVALPLLVATWAHYRVKLRRLWLQEVAADRIPGWRIVDGAPHAVSALAPLLTATSPARPDAVVRVLVETQPARDPFRDAEARQPVALVVEDVRSRGPRGV